MEALTAAFPMVSFFLDGGSNMTGIPQLRKPATQPGRAGRVSCRDQQLLGPVTAVCPALWSRAVTRSGTNQFHGSLFEFVRNTALNATPWNATLNPPYHRNQFGGAVGGPVKHDKAFFFFSYAGLRQTVGQFLSGGVVPTALERQGRLYGIEGDSGRARHQGQGGRDQQLSQLPGSYRGMCPRPPC